MARLIGPDEACRVVYLTGGTNAGKAAAQGLTAAIYTDIGLTAAADILTEAGAAISNSTITVDAYSRLPLFQFPDGVDTLYTSVNGGPVTALYARTDDRLDTLQTRVTALEPGGAGEAATAAALTAHAVDTTSIHGIADTAALLTTSGGTVTGGLTVQGTLAVTTAATITVGADTNLYRVGADQLATDDALFVGGRLHTYGNLTVDGNVGFYGTGAQAKPAVTGSRGGNAALASLLTQLAALGLITDSTSA
jgi:hypothetical protein